MERTAGVSAVTGRGKPPMATGLVARLGAAVVAAAALLLSTAAPAKAQSRRWEIVPKLDARLKAGRLSVVGGETREDGVHFVVNNLEVTQPIEIALVAQDSSRRLQLLVYKDSPEKALLERATDAGGAAAARFRTADSIQLLVTGPAGARYQLMTWVGPRVVVEAPPAFVPVDAAGSPLSADASPDGSLPARRTPPAAAPTTSPIPVSTAIAVLLGLILVALVAIIFLLQRARGKAAAGLLLALLLARPGAAQESPPNLQPHAVKPTDETKETKSVLEGIRELINKAVENGVEADLEEFKVPSGKKDETEPEKPSLKGFLNEGPGAIQKRAARLVTAAKFLLAMLEDFGLIDPREAAIQPNYNPPGQPLIPSRCAGTGDCGRCFTDATARLDKARRLLEEQYVIYRQTELKAGRIHELAGAAADLSGFAKLAWTAARSNPREPMNVAQQRFYDIYDGNLTRLLAMLNEGLIGVGACEREQFQDDDWYPRYGLVYYNFMTDRYTRKQVGA